MSEIKIEKLKKKIEILEKMIEDKTRALFLEKENTKNYAKFVETVINSLSEFIMVIDKKGEIVLNNKKSAEFFNFVDGEKNIRKVLGDDLVDRLIEEEKSGAGQVTTELAVGTKKQIPVVITRIHFENKSISKDGFIYSVMDLSMLREKETIIEEQKAQLIQSTQLASLGEMASGIAHEINNPVTIMEGQLRRLIDFFDDEEMKEDDYLRLARKLEGNLGRIVDIVNGIRKISRNKDLDQLEDIPVKEIIETAKSMCKEKFRTQKIDLSFHLDSPEMTILAKETLILQVLVNLITNSSDAICTLGEKWIKVFFSENTTHSKIRVLDSGKGISEEIRAKIFNPFYTTKDVGKGTGIGLSISKKMIEELDGGLDYEFHCGHTSFVITLKK